MQKGDIIQNGTVDQFRICEYRRQKKHDHSDQFKPIRLRSLKYGIRLANRYSEADLTKEGYSVKVIL